MDSFMVFGVGLLSLYFMLDIKFDNFDIAEGILTSFFMMGSNIYFTKGLESGKGGPVTSINTSSSLMVLALNVAVNGIVPSYLQAAGVGLAVTGATIMGLAK